MANDNVELLRLGHRIQAERKALGLSQNGFAKDCGLKQNLLWGNRARRRKSDLRGPLQDLQRTSLRYCQCHKGNSAGILRPHP